MCCFPCHKSHFRNAPNLDWDLTCGQLLQISSIRFSLRIAIQESDLICWHISSAFHWNRNPHICIIWILATPWERKRPNRIKLRGSSKIPHVLSVFRQSLLGICQTHPKHQQLRRGNAVYISISITMMIITVVMILLGGWTSKPAKQWSDDSSSERLLANQPSWPTNRKV